MKIYKIGLTILACLVLFSNAGSIGVEGIKNSGKKYILKYNLPKGTKFTIKQTFSSEENMNVQGNEQIVVRSSGFTYDCIVNKVNGNSLEIELTFAEKSYETESPVGVNSRDYSELIGKKVVFDLLPNGSVNAFKGFDLLPSSTQNADPKAAAKSYVNSMNVLFPELPSGPVEIGDVWMDKKVIESGFMGKGSKKITTTEYTYKLVEETKVNGIPCLVIEVKFVQTIKGEGKHSIGSKLTEESQNDGTSKIYFAYTKGMFISKETKSIREGEITMEGAGVFPVTDERKSEQKVIIK